MTCCQAISPFVRRLKRPWLGVGCLIYGVLTALPDVKPAHFGLDAGWFPGFSSPLLQGLFQGGEAFIVLALAPLGWQDSNNSLCRWTRAALQVPVVVLAGYMLLQYPLRLIGHQTVNIQGKNPAELLFPGLVFLLLAVLLGWGIRWCELKSQTLLALLKQTQEAQWNLLRSQLSPHLVLNVLSGLAGLAEEDPAKASKGLKDLATVYQQLLALGEIEQIRLSQERELLECYLNVEKIRLEDNLRIQWQWDRSLDALRVPPLLIQPLVENAIKHGINASDTGGELILIAQREARVILIEVRNTGGFLHKKSAQTGAGIGIKNLRHRILLAFGEGATLSFRQQDLWTIATLHIPLSQFPL